MTAPVRLQLSRCKGFDLQALSRQTNGLPAHSVARPGPWGNPFVVGRDGNQAYCYDLFMCVLEGLTAINKPARVDDQVKTRRYVAEHIDELRGKNLACWCRPGTPCHADVLLELANRERS